jgi:hypothetical protein
MAVNRNATEYLGSTHHLIFQNLKSQELQITKDINILSSSPDLDELDELIRSILTLKESSEDVSRQYTLLAGKMKAFSTNLRALYDIVYDRLNSLPKSQESLSGDTFFISAHRIRAPVVVRKPRIDNVYGLSGYTSEYASFRFASSPAASEEEGEPPTVSPDEDSLEDELGSVSSRSTSGSDDSDIPSDVMPRISSESKEMD